MTIKTKMKDHPAAEHPMERQPSPSEEGLGVTAQTARMSPSTERTLVPAWSPDSRRGRTTPQTDDNGQPSRSGKTAHQSNRPANQSVLGLRLVEVWEKLRKENTPISRIAHAFNVSQSTVEYWAGHVQPDDKAVEDGESWDETLQQPNALRNYPNDVLQFPNENGPTNSTVPGGARDETVEYPTITAETGHASSTGRIPGRPIRILINPDDPRLQSFFVELAGMAAARGVSFQDYFMTNACIEDLRDTTFAKTLVSGDGQDFRSNLLTQTRKANAHDRMLQNTGLERGTLEERRN